jgi:hypothetical protein
MKITIRQMLIVTNTAVINGAGSLSRFFATAKPPTIAWASRRAPKLVDEAIKDYNQAEREIFTRHGDDVKDASGAVVGITVRESEKEIHAKEIAELRGQIVDLPGDCISVVQLIDPKLSEVDMLALEESGFLKE